MSSSIDPQLIFVDRVSHCTWVSHIRLEPTSPKCPPVSAPSIGVPSAHHSIWLFYLFAYLSARDGTRVLRLTQDAICHLSHLPSPLSAHNEEKARCGVRLAHPALGRWRRKYPWDLLGIRLDECRPVRDPVP